MSDLMSYGSNELGRVEIAPEVIQVIAGLAATDVDGVYSLSGGVVDDITQLLGRKNFRKGVRVELGERIDLEISVVLHYGANIPSVGEEVQTRVKAAVEAMTSLPLGEICVRIEGIRHPKPEKEKEKPELLGG